MRALSALALALLVGAPGCYAAPCATGACVEALPPTGAMDAAGLVWRAYGEAGPLPGLTWIERGDCADGIVSDGECTAGAYRPPLDHAWVTLASSQGDWRAVLVHELLHAHLRRLYGDGDGTHKRPEWVTLQRLAFAALGPR